MVGAEATKLFADAQAMLKKMIAENWVEARAVFGLFPANTVNDDDIAVYADESRTKTLMTWHNLRQQMKKPEGRANLCLADFVAPKASGLKDYLGAFVVTAGIGEDERAKAFEAAHDDYSAILFKSLCDRLAEAFAEHLHLRVRREFWGYASEEALANDELIAEKYQGIRPAPGYPACPEHSEKAALFDLLDATAAHRRQAHRKLRHVAGRRGVRLLPVAPRQPVFRGGQDRARPGRGLRPPQGLDAGGSRTLAGAESGLPARLILTGQGLPALLQHLLQPEQPDHGLGLADLAVAQPVHRLAERHPQDFQKLVGVAAVVAGFESARQIERQPLVRIADAGIDGGDFAPLAWRCSRFPLPVRAWRKSGRPRRSRSCRLAVR